MQQKIEEIENLSQTVKDRLGFGNTVIGTQRQEVFNKLVGELKAQLQSTAAKKEEEKKAFEQFVTIMHSYYKELESIYQAEVATPSARLKVSGEILDVSWKYLYKVDKLSRDFNTAAYWGKAILNDLAVLCMTNIIQAAVVSVFFAALAIAGAPVLPLLPQVILFMTLVNFGGIAALRAGMFAFGAARDTLVTATKPVFWPSFDTFGFFQKEAEMACETLWSVRDESQKAVDSLKQTDLKVS